MPHLTIALAQLSPLQNPDASREAGLRAVTAAGAAGADIVVFPEMWQIGYVGCPATGPYRAAWQARAITPEALWLNAFRSAARDTGVAVLATYLRRDPAGQSNAATLIDATGTDVLSYRKVHTCDFGWEAVLQAGDGFPVTTLTTAAGPVRVGVMICYDREFPESARLLMLGGAEVVLVPNACEMTDDRHFQLRARAYENMTAMALANYAGPDYQGGSCAFDAMAHQADGTPRDHTLVRAGDDEQIVMAKLDLSALRAYREREIWADAYRRPSRYEEISRVASARPPFARARPRTR